LYFFADFNYQRLPRLIPLPPQHLIAREELLKKISIHICKVNHNPGEGSVCLTLTGGGGFGKTTLCLALCQLREVREMFKNGIVFVELGPKCQDSNIILNHHYCQLIGKKFKNRPINDVEMKIKAFTEKFNKYLVIIDDVWDVAVTRSVINAFINCKIILTTRRTKLEISAKKIIDIGPMSEKEATELITYGISDGNSELKINPQSLSNLAEMALNWPLLLSLLRGQIYNRMLYGKMSCQEAIQQVQTKLIEMGITSLDQNIIDLSYLSRQKSIKICVEASLQMLSKSTLDRYLSLVLMTGVGGYLPKAVLSCLWDTTKTEAEFTINELELYGLVLIVDKRMPPKFTTTDLYVKVHIVLSEYCISNLDSEKIAFLSPYICLKARKIVDEEAIFVFQESYGVTDLRSLSEKEFLEYNKGKLEFVIIPHYVNEISMHAIHDPHLVKLMLQKIQEILADINDGNLMLTFINKIGKLLEKCVIAVKRARLLSRNINQKFQKCFNAQNFDDMIQTIADYCKTEFISKVTYECVEIVLKLSTHCNESTKQELLQKMKELQNVTPEYHPIALEKLPRLKLHTELHKRVTKALNEHLTDMQMVIYDELTFGAFNEKVKLIHDEYLKKISDI